MIKKYETEEERRNAHKMSCLRYEKTFNGYLMRMYRNMKSRITGIQWRKEHLYKGKELLSKEDFYNWAKNHEDYKKLYENYVKSGYEQKLAPTVDRIDSSKGYIIENMRWLTHSENSRLGNISRYSTNNK